MENEKKVEKKQTPKGNVQKKKVNHNKKVNRNKKKLNSEKQNKKVKNKGGKIISLILIVLFIIMVVAIIGNGRKHKNTSKNSNQDSAQNVANTVDYVEEIEQGVKLNESTKLNEAKTVDGLTFSNIQLTTKDGMSTLLADVINNSGSKTELKQIKVTLLDKDYKEIITLSGIVTGLEPGANTELNIAMTSDYVNAYDLKIEVVK